MKTGKFAEMQRQISRKNSITQWSAVLPALAVAINGLAMHGVYVTKYGVSTENKDFTKTVTSISIYPFYHLVRF